MAKNVVHISEAEAASDFAALMARVRAARRSSSKAASGLWLSFTPPNQCAAPFPSALR